MVNSFQYAKITGSTAAAVDLVDEQALRQPDLASEARRFTAVRGPPFLSCGGPPSAGSALTGPA
jgi:hypothetical protein